MYIPTIRTSCPKLKRSYAAVPKGSVAVFIQQIPQYIKNEITKNKIYSIFSATEIIRLRFFFVKYSHKVDTAESTSE